MSDNVISFPNGPAHAVLGDLSRFTGTDAWVWHADAESINAVQLSEGVTFVVSKAEAIWLIDYIVLMQKRRAGFLAAQAFQVWRLTINDDRMTEIICEDGDGLQLQHRRIGKTNFPQPGVTMWLVDGRIFLPSEY